MTTALIAASLLGLQNPADPKVKLPAGWRLARAARSDMVAIVGPKGQEIGFPDYFPTGKVAEVTKEMDRKTFLITAVLGGYMVDVALSPQGFFAVSFDRGPNGSEESFDFWSKVGNAREIAETLSIALTRIESLEGATPPGSDDLVYRHFVTGHRSAQTDTKPPVWMQNPTSLQVELRAELPVGATPTFSGRVLGGTLVLAETKDGALAAAYGSDGAPLSGRTVAVVSKDDLPASILAILAALTRRTPKG